MIMIIIVTVAFAWLPLAVYLAAPVPTVRWLRAFDGWLRRYRRQLLVAVIGIVGVLLVIQGSAGLA